MRGRLETDAPMEYQDQSAASLILAVTMDAVDWNQFTVLRDGELRGGPARVRAAIIGESHLLAVETPSGDTLSEVFACVRPELERPPCFQDVLPRLPRTVAVVAKGSGGRILYHCRPRLTSWVHGRRYAGDLQRRGGKRDGALLLSFRFPSKNSLGDAITTFLAHWDARTLTVSTAHCYPNEERAVITESLITVPEPEGDL